MPPNLALLICFAGIGGLFYLDRDDSIRTSKALWIPVTWIWIVGSRPVSVWFGLTPGAGVDVQMDGSPADRIFFLLLLLAGVGVALRRKRRTSQFLASNWPILAYFGFCLLSVSWSDYPDISFKRWTKAIGDLVMVLVIVTEAQPVGALKRVLARAGFVLLPPSIVLIKYFGDLGRAYTPDGEPMNTGVTTNKNMLGVITLVLALGAVWRVLTLLQEKGYPNRRRHLIAQLALLAFAVTVLGMSHSATSEACFALGTVLIVLTRLRWVRRRPGRVHAVMLAIIMAGGMTLLFGGKAGVTHALGRKENLTDRTQIWDAVLRVAPNAAVGAGFESFWLGPRLAEVYSGLSQYMHVNEAHNGYIEVYLNLGWTGVILISIILLRGYSTTARAFRRDPAMGSLMLAYVAASAIYSITEAGFRLLDPIWIFLLLAVIASGGIASGVTEQPQPPIQRPRPQYFPRRHYQTTT